MTRSASAGTGDQPARGAGQLDRGLRPGQVERGQRGAPHLGRRGVDGIQRHPVGTPCGDKQVVRRARVDDALDGAGERVAVGGDR